MAGRRRHNGEILYLGYSFHCTQRKCVPFKKRKKEREKIERLIEQHWEQFLRIYKKTLSTHLSGSNCFYFIFGNFFFVLFKAFFFFPSISSSWLSTALVPFETCFYRSKRHAATVGGDNLKYTGSARAGSFLAARKVLTLVCPVFLFCFVVSSK